MSDTAGERLTYMLSLIGVPTRFAAGHGRFSLVRVNVN